MSWCSFCRSRDHPYVRSALLALGLLVTASLHRLYVVDATLSPQSLSMVRAAQAESPVEVLGSTGPWLPAYPLLLHAANAIRLPLWSVNLLLFWLTLLLLAITLKRHFPHIGVYWVVLLYAACGACYYNLAQFTSEALVIPVSLVVFLALLAYLQQSTFRTLLALALACALLFFTRYHAMLWLLPLVVGYLALNCLPWRQRLAHLALFGWLALGPVGAFMLRNLLLKGHLTGMERFSYESRELRVEVAYYVHSTDLTDNILLTLKTYLVDFLSPFAFATHATNRLPYTPSLGEEALLVLLIGVGGVGLRTWYRYGPRLSFGLSAPPTPTRLWVEFLVAYLLVTLMVWTLGNNDPIYTRFLYPSYVYLIVLLFALYSLVKQHSTCRLPRILFGMLYASVLFANIYKTLSIALP